MPGKQYYVGYIQNNNILTQKNIKGFYYQAVVKCNFTPDIIFYNVLSDTNGKILLQIYIDQILNLVVKSWLLEKQDFALKKDDNSKHGKTQNCNII